jgi:D-serine deaminase-like pyridoxal phosphate-dependent protein
VAGAATVKIAADNAANVAELSAAAYAAGVTLGVLVEMDIGMGRAGVRSLEAALDLARDITRAPGLRFRGLLGYEGHIVDLPAFDERAREAHTSLAKLGEARRAIEGAGIPVECVSAGGTGTYAITSRLSDLTEVEVGSYVFMDAAYTQIEGMERFESALTVLATVTSRPSGEVVIVDAGLKNMGGEYGTARLLDWPEARCAFVSEEHARFDFPDEPGLRIGDRVRVVPPHCCTTSNLHDRFYAVRDGAIEAIWPIEARGRSQ